MKIVWLGLLMAFSLVAIGGNEAGNGGSSVVCPNKPPELLDFYENLILGDLTPDLGGYDDPARGARVAFDRLKRLDPDRAAAYERTLETFFDNARFIDDLILPDTKDYGHVPLKKECRIEQLAVQREPMLPGYKRYLINRTLWTGLPKDHRAGLVIHEIVYGDAIGLGHKDSINSRYFTAFISSKNIEAMSPKQYEALLRQLGFKKAGDQPPAWVMNPVRLPGAMAKTPYSASVAAFAHHPAGRPMTFEKIAGPSWLRVAKDGIVSGTPVDDAENTFVIAVRDPDGRTATANVLIVVHSPGVKWKSSVIDLGVQKEGFNFTYDLRHQVNSLEGKHLYFSAAGLPPWLKLDPMGVLTGRPDRPHVGAWNATFMVTTITGESGAVAEGRGVVTKTLKSPVWLVNPIQLTAKEDEAFRTDLGEFVSNVQSIPYEITLVSGPSWLAVSNMGIVTGTPKKGDVGESRAVFRLRWTLDGFPMHSDANLFLRVKATNHPPFWIRNPVHFDICPGGTSVQVLTKYVQDVDGDALTFHLHKGETWARIVNNDLIMSPPADEKGVSDLTVSAYDGQHATPVTIRVTVGPPCP